MNLYSLAKIAESILNGPIPNPSLVLKMPGRWGVSGRKRLCGRNSPVGQIVRETPEGLIVVFEASEILVWCKTQGVDICPKSNDEEVSRRLNDGRY